MRMEYAIALEDVKRLGERLPRVELPPFARMAHPIDVEPVRSNTVEPHEWSVEFLALVVFHAGPVALDESIARACPGAVNVDDIVPSGRFYLREELRFEEISNDGLAGLDDGLLLGLGR